MPKNALCGERMWIPMHAYCLFCETQKASFIAQMIEQNHGFRCISPQIIQRKWVKGVCLEEKHNWLPGYIFFYTDEPLERKFYFPGVLRWLGEGELKGEDRAFADMLYERGGVMGTIRLAEVGDRCVVNEPAWRGLEGRIVKLDRGRKRCCVEFSFDNSRITAWVGYEMVGQVE